MKKKCPNKYTKGSITCFSNTTGSALFLAGACPFFYLIVRLLFGIEEDVLFVHELYTDITRRIRNLEGMSMP